ncbi:MAG: hypothetical protein LBU96_07175 [Yokenella regensburgei]|jgi:hypothetical protein|nr:hypothetical protein [Yokenella regensburgei]
MPVDLTSIPERAENRSPPSVRRWLVFLLALLAGNGLITAWLWPAGMSTHIPLFWICFPGGAIVLWVVLVIVRSAIFLTPVFGNGGWNDTRERDLALEIQRGQRSLVMRAQAVHLPHVAASGSLSGQLLIPGAIALPPVTGNGTSDGVHQARFGDVSLPVADRLKARFQALLSDNRIQTVLRELPAQSPLTVALLTGQEESVPPEHQQMAARIIGEITGSAFRLSFINSAGPEMLDRWLDEQDRMQSLLVLAVNLTETEADGTGEAAVALLLQRDNSPVAAPVVSVHRPEQTQPEQGMTYALQQALLWGMTTPEDIQQIWMTGTGTKNKADGLFSATGMRFPAAGQPCDIDLRTGLTGCASPWLAMAVAAEHLRVASPAQLLMSVDGDKGPPWFMVIRTPVASV